MESIPKFLASMITIIVGVLICISFVVTTVVVNSARTFHASIITEMEASNFDEVIIQKCKEAAESSGYVLNVEQAVPESGASTQTFYKVTLNYNLSAPIFGIVHNGEVVGYALSGMYPTDIAIVTPKSPQTGDVFVYGDYEYRYNCEYTAGSGWVEAPGLSGWGARVKNSTQTRYSRPLSTIGDTSVLSLSSTYYNCTNLLSAPAIPSGVKNLNNTYSGCTSLTTAPTISANVTVLTNTFENCTSLTGNVEINAISLADYSDCFKGTTKSIILSGTNSQLEFIAAEFANVSVEGVDDEAA